MTEAVESVTDRGTKSHYEQHQQLVDSPLKNNVGLDECVGTC